MAITKKLPFEKWETKSFAKKARAEENEKRKFKRGELIIEVTIFQKFTSLSVKTYY